MAAMLAGNVADSIQYIPDGQTIETMGATIGVDLPKGTSISVQKKQQSHQTVQIQEPQLKLTQKLQSSDQH